MSMSSTETPYWTQGRIQDFHGGGGGGGQKIICAHAHHERKARRPEVGVQGPLKVGPWKLSRYLTLSRTISVPY